MSILGITPESRPPFQGDFLSVSLPRPEGPTPQSDSTELAEVLRRDRSMPVNRLQDSGAPQRSEGGLGYSLFVLRAMAKCLNSRA